MISNDLRERDCIVLNAHGDAVEKPLLHTTTLIGDNTYLLVLFIDYTQGDSKGL